MIEPHRRQHRVDVACGYALGAYLGVGLCWVGALLNSSALFFFALLIAGFAGFFGSLRTLMGLAPRFWLLPVGAAVYALGVFICLYYAAPLVIAIAGAAFSIAFAPLVYRLFKHDFAKTVPPWVCKGCGYTLLGLTEPACPECGKAFDPDRVPKMADTPEIKDDRLQ